MTFPWTRTDADAKTPLDAPRVVNGQRLDAAACQRLATQLQGLPAGRCWYDAATGAWGQEGGPTTGWLAPLLPLPGPLRADASGGGSGRLSGVFINGRELHPLDVAGLQRLSGRAVWPGSWWVDAQGRFGPMLGRWHGPAIGSLGPSTVSMAAGAGDGSWSLASPDGRRHVGVDSDGVAGAKGVQGEVWFGS